MKKKPYNGNELRVDGYYYIYYGNPQRMDIYFFYRNGVCLSGESPLVSELSIEEANFGNGTYYNSIKDLKYNWGVFQVLNGDFRFERWFPSQPPFRAYIEYCEILNDTTFRIYRSTISDGSEEKTKNETYHFKQFSPKPDSTNSFVE